MPSRRAVLSGIGTFGVTATAGCAGVLGGAPARHHIDLMNGDESAHSFAVTIFDAKDRVLFEHTYDLDAGEGDENRIIKGAPTRLEASLDGGEPTVLEWQPTADPSFATDRMGVLTARRQA